ncbi:calcium homeostasis modulator protein 3 [Erpetoichthys calabaricus]|uniref:Calcium homeostasis modulator 3 n=1 Tax=Erpetoichthys calabaricus TaxID=27687 RepID=A0A8C4S3T0_ERPCA|nr:calcium homeostasis modulator protein 3 [Erpetoichthys calabaricus]
MDRFRMIFQYFQSNSESVMNGICAMLALASVKIYSSFDFNCPCMPWYNVLYGMGVMFIPPVVLFLCGVIINKHTVMMLEEWTRPAGRRHKNAAVVRYMFFSMLQRALLAPLVWIIVTLLDGKCFICAFSISVDSSRFVGFPNDTGLDISRVLAKVPCKEDEIFRNSTSRKAVARYLRCWSQALGWGILLFLIVLAALARSFKPCFNQAAFLQTRYWSNYVDIEQKIFDETCCIHARDFARKCVIQFFETIHSEMQEGLLSKPDDDEDPLHGITTREQVNQLLKTWYRCKPELDVTKIAQRLSRAKASVSSGDGLPKSTEQHCCGEGSRSKYTIV